MVWRFAAALVAGVVGTAAAAPPAVAPLRAREVSYPLQDPFLAPLKDGHVAAIGVALTLPVAAVPSAPGVLADPAAGAEAPQDRMVRDVVIQVLAHATRRDVLGRRGRHRLERRLLRRVRARTDLPASSFFFTDVAVR